jgi:hypothetical protein
MKIRPTILTALLISAAAGSASAQTYPIGRWWDSRPAIERLPSNDPNFAAAEWYLGSIGGWNRFIDFFDVVDSDGSFANDNNDCELVGFLTDAQLNALYADNWGTSTLAIAIRRFDTSTGNLVEGDVIFNPIWDWTTNVNDVWADSSMYLWQEVLLHELGNVWGADHNDEINLYSAVMNSTVDRQHFRTDDPFHLADALTFRQYNALPINSMTDVAVFSYEFSGGGITNAAPSQSSFQPGEALTGSSFTIENIGTTSATITAQAYLSTNQGLSSGDILVGETTFTMAAESALLFPVSGVVPTSVPDGDYYYGLLLQVSGDAFITNNAAVMFNTVSIREQCTDDIYEPNDNVGQAENVDGGSYHSLQLCAGNEDWFRITLNAGNAADITLNFSHAVGDLDLYVYDQVDIFNPIAQSISVTDGEQVFIPAPTAMWTYYIVVEGYSTDPGNPAENSYDMHIDQPDSLEPNETAFTPVEVNHGSYYPLSVGGNDVDWYQVWMEEGQELTVELIFQHSHGDIDMNFFGFGLGEYYISESASDNEILSGITAAGTGYHLLHVYSYDGIGNTYQLKITKGCHVAFESYGSGLAGSGGLIPQFTGTPGSCYPLGHHLHIQNALGGSFALLFIGLQEADLPYRGGSLLVDLGTYWMFTLRLGGALNVPGAGSLTIPGGDASVLEGVNLALQLHVLDPGAPQGFALSPGLRMVVGGLVP